MTKINKMVMHGFKSFAKRTELLFGDDFNCVLGPNGSGKSNLIDSLCFVLGRSSSKSLRAEKSANLIYNGGKKKKPASHGEVSIYFDNASKVFPSDDKEVKVTRIVKKSGQSVYKINDKNRTRQEVLDLLSVAKINPDGYNIILQGDVIRFVEMSSIERRQIVEEVSGISVYEDKKKKALSELNKVEDKLKEAEIILTERKTYLNELKRERDQALKYKELSSKVKSNKATYLHKKIDRQQKQKTDFDTKISDQKQKLQKTQDEIIKIKEIINTKKEKIKGINTDIEEKGEKQQVALHKEIEELKVKLATSKTKKENYSNEITKIEERKKNLDRELKDNREQLHKLNEKKQSVADQIKNLTLDQNNILTQLQKFKDKKGIESATEIDKEIEAVDKEAEEKQKSLQVLVEKQQNLFRDKDKIEFQIQNLDEQVRKVREVEKESHDQIQELKNKKQQFKKAISDLNEKLESDSEFASKIRTTREKLFSNQEHLSKLNARNAVVKDRAGSNIAVQKIIAQRNSMKGIYDTVSGLGKVTKKYSVALEIAAGGRINSIVVESDSTAASCIKYLKQNRLGTATFIPLNKIKPPSKNPNINQLLNKPGTHGLAVDLVNYEPRFQKVFQHVFGDTLVVDNIETARKLGIGSARMVTLDGDLAEPSGVMRGGFRHKKGGSKFQEKEMVKDITEYEEVIASLQNTLSSIESSRNKNEEEIVHCREFKANLEGEIIKLEKSLHLESGDINSSLDQKKDFSKSFSEIQERLEKTNNLVSELNQSLAQNKIKRQQLRNRITSLRNPTILAELNAFEEKKQEIRDNLVHLNSDLKNLDAQVNLTSGEYDKITGIVKQHDKEIENFQSVHTSLSKEIIQGIEELKGKEQKQKEFYTKFKKMFAQRDELNKEINKEETKIEAMQEISRSTEIKMNTLTLENAKVTAELSGLRQEFTQFEGVKILASKTEEDLKRDIDKFARLVENMSAVNMKALEIYESVEKEYNSLIEKKDTLTGEKDSVLSMIEEIEDRKKEIFVKTLENLNTNFQNIFSSLTTKGEASLILESPENPFEAGLRIMVRLSGKKFLDIRSLSGGEKTLTALAFIYSIQEHDPHSFYVLDEVDAALDKANSEKLARHVRKYCDGAQYIVISHNDAVISEADNLYGVSMDEHGMTNVTSLKL